MGWDVNVHANLRQQLMLRTRGVGGVGLGGMMRMMRMMMMNVTQMKRVNSATKFRHGMDKFYQPNSGLRSSRSLDEAIYTYTHICICIILIISIPEIMRGSP